MYTATHLGGIYALVKQWACDRHVIIAWSVAISNSDHLACVHVVANSYAFSALRCRLRLATIEPSADATI